MKKMLSLLLVTVLCLSLVPASALAEEVLPEEAVFEEVIPDASTEGEPSAEEPEPVPEPEELFEPEDESAEPEEAQEPSEPTAADADGDADGNYLTFSSDSSFTITISTFSVWNGTIYYSTDASSWETWYGSELTAVKKGGKYHLYFRGSGNTCVSGYIFSLNPPYEISSWQISGQQVACSGNIETLLDYEAVARGEHPEMQSYCFNSMFYGCTSLTEAPELPATSLTDYCYQYMFYGCTSLTEAPELPATALAYSCYCEMFFDCTALTKAPALPATALAEECYRGMFRGCTSLTKAPALPATALAYGCYLEMFLGCTSLTKAPALPATELAESCYCDMFSWCTALTEVPTLPATSLADRCYYGMFYGCTALKLSSYYKDASGYTVAWDCFAKVTITGTDSLKDMFANTGGTFKGTPSVGKIYYLQPPPPGSSITVSDGTPYKGEIRFDFRYQNSIAEDTEISVGRQKCIYSDSFFYGSSTTYDHALATFSLCATMTATSPGNEKDGYVTDDYIVELLKNMGCDEQTIYTQKFDILNTTADTCAFAFGLKKLADTDDYLVSVIIRSSAYGGEWASDFNIYDKSYPNYAVGFKKAEEGVYAALKQYISVIENQGVSRNKLKLWITGYSRGAAVSNLLGADLNDDCFIDPSRLFVYTFATPPAVASSQKVAYTNIFNIISQIDPVPRVPLASWGYARYGRDCYLPCRTKNGKTYSTRLKAMQNQFNSIMSTNGISQQYNPIDGQEAVLDLLLDYVDDAVTSPEVYYEDGFQRLMVDTMGSMYTDGVTTREIVVSVLTALTNGDEAIAEDLLSLYSGEDIPASTWSYCINSFKRVAKVSTNPYSGAATRVVTVLAEYAAMKQANLVSFDFTSLDYYGRLEAMIADTLKNGRCSALAMQHWPESYLAWMRSGTADQLFSKTSYTKLSIKCPVDVYVYDSSDQLVAKIVNDEADGSIEESLYACVNGLGEKEVYLPEDDTYRVEVIAREPGIVSIVSETYSDGAEPKTVESYVELPMEAEQTFSLSCDGADLAVETEGETLTPDAEGAPVPVTVTVTTAGDCPVSGAGEYAVGDTVELVAQADDYTRFDGWYEDESYLSGSEVFTFVASGDRELEAVFKALDPGDLNGDGNVNASDLVAMMKYLSGCELYVKLGALDVSGDGETDLLDLVALMKALAE